MLEKNLNELDNDFITLWSKYLTTGNLNLDTLTRLAELGQVNAIQEYYLNEEDAMFPNHTIAKNCEKLGNDFNGRYAKACGNYLINTRENPRATRMFLNGPMGEMAKALVLAKMDYEEKGNELSGETYLEMLYSLSEANLDENALRDLSKLAVEIREKLEKGYERLGEPQYAFAIGKNMFLIGETAEILKGGENLLKELANREYSKKLTNHTLESDLEREISK